MRTASGIINAQHKLIAVVVLITAGYAADGKYSHFLLVQSPLILDGHSRLNPGTYVIGWQRASTGLELHIFNSMTGVEESTDLARPIPGTTRVESFHIWPPGEHRGIQIGRFYLPYTLP